MSWGKVVTARPPTRSAQFAHVRSLCLQRQAAKFASGLLYYWSLLHNNNTESNFKCSLQVTVVGVLPHVNRASHWGFFQPDLYFSRPVCLGLIMTNRVKSVFFEVINSSATWYQYKDTLHYSVYIMRTSGEKVRISDKAERIQSVSYSHIRSLSGSYTVVCLRKQVRHLPRSPFATVRCKVPCFQRNPQQQL